MILMRALQKLSGPKISLVTRLLTSCDLICLLNLKLGTSVGIDKPPERVQFLVSSYSMRSFSPLKAKLTASSRKLASRYASCCLSASQPLDATEKFSHQRLLIIVQFQKVNYLSNFKKYSIIY